MPLATPRQDLYHHAKAGHPYRKENAYHRHKVGQLGHEVDVDGAQAVRGDEEKRHVDARVSEFGKRVGALGILLALNVLAVLVLDVLQNRLPALLQRIVACPNACLVTGWPLLL